MNYKNKVFIFIDLSLTSKAIF